MAKENVRKKEKKQTQSEVFSYHTFMFPFLYEMNKTTAKKFMECCHPGWFADVWEPEKMNEAVYYNQYHYFNESAHNAIYMKKSPSQIKNFETEAVINLRFDLLSLAQENPTADPEREKKRSHDMENSIKYVIRKGDNQYALDVHAVRMKLYNTGVGILMFELENRKYSAEKDVIAINDFGRRIYAAYYAHANDRLYCSICADEIYLEINGNALSKGKTSLLPNELRSSAETTILAEPIMRLLSNEKYRITTKKNCGKDEFCIEPVIDDRMFVACYYKNGDFVDAMREWDGENYRYMTHAKEKNPFDNKENGNAANRLYTMMYVDGDGICCHSRSMLQNLLSDDHIYTRWLEYGWVQNQTKQNEFAGTITGFSEYTMISVAKNPPDYLVSAFLTQYVEMATLVLAQRASLLSFEYMISECARGEKTYKVDDIQKKYTLFQSQILLKEVSPQQQGIELYDMLEKNLMIEKEQNEIKEQINGLFEQKNFDHDRKENRILFWLSLFGVVEAANTAVDMFSLEEGGSGLNLCIKVGVIMAVGLTVFFTYQRKK